MTRRELLKRIGLAPIAASVPAAKATQTLVLKMDSKAITDAIATAAATIAKAVKP